MIMIEYMSGPSGRESC